MLYFVLPILLLNFNVIYSRLITSARKERADLSALNYMLLWFLL